MSALAMAMAQARAARIAEERGTVISDTHGPCIVCGDATSTFPRQFTYAVLTFPYCTDIDACLARRPDLGPTP